MALQVHNFYICTGEIMTQKLPADPGEAGGAIGCQQRDAATTPYVIGQRQMLQHLLDGGGRRTGRINNRYRVVEYRRKCISQQWKMGAAEDDAVRTTCPLVEFRQIAHHDRFSNRAIVPTFFSERHEQFTGKFCNDGACIHAQ